MKPETRIYKRKTYFVQQRRGISGFQQWGSYDYGIASGATVKSRNLEVGMTEHQGNLNVGQRFRLEDGHLPDYQTRATFDEADRFVQGGVGRIAWIVPDTPPAQIPCPDPQGPGDAFGNQG